MTTKSYGEFDNKYRKFPTYWEKKELRESTSKLTKAFQKLRQIYQSGKRYNAKEWIKLMSDLLDSID